MSILLQKLRKHTFPLVRVWDRFNSDYGDISYFSDIKGPQGRECLRRIRTIFERALDQEQRLSFLDSSVRSTIQTVSNPNHSPTVR